VEFLEGGLDGGTVVAVGDAAPVRGGGQDADAGAAGVGQSADSRGEIEFGAGVGTADGEEFFEFAVEQGKEGGGEGPAVHRDEGVGGKVAESAVGLARARAAGGVGFESGLLFEAEQETGGVHAADAARDGAVFGKGVAEAEADEGEVRGGGVGGAEVTGQLAKGVGAVKIVGVDDGKRLAHLGAGAPDGVAGAPGFFARDGRGEAAGQVAGFLKGVADVEAAAGVGFADAAAEFVGKIAADDEDDAAEAGAAGVVEGVVKNGPALGADGVHLLQAAIAAAQAGGENDQARRRHWGYKKRKGQGEKGKRKAGVGGDGI
jgi:hypothetical protein